MQRKRQKGRQPGSQARASLVLTNWAIPVSCTLISLQTSLCTANATWKIFLFLIRTCATTDSHKSGLRPSASRRRIKPVKRGNHRCVAPPHIYQASPSVRTTPEEVVGWRDSFLCLKQDPLTSTHLFLSVAEWGWCRGDGSFQSLFSKVYQRNLIQPCDGGVLSLTQGAAKTRELKILTWTAERSPQGEFCFSTGVS